jgi:hypothetical protein
VQVHLLTPPRQLWAGISISSCMLMPTAIARVVQFSVGLLFEPFPVGAVLLLAAVCDIRIIFKILNIVVIVINVSVCATTINVIASVSDMG